MAQQTFETDKDLPPIPLVHVLSEEEQEQHLKLADVTHVVIQMSDSRQRAVVESIGVAYDPQKSSPYWCFYGAVAAQALFANPQQLRLLNATKIRSREFIAFTNITYAQERQRTGIDGPIRVVEVDILKPRHNEPLELFWKPARGLISQKVLNWVTNLSHYDISAPITRLHGQAHELGELDATNSCRPRQSSSPL